MNRNEDQIKKNEEQELNQETNLLLTVKPLIRSKQLYIDEIFEKMKFTRYHFFLILSIFLIKISI